MSEVTSEAWTQAVFRVWPDVAAGCCCWNREGGSWSKGGRSLPTPQGEGAWEALWRSINPTCVHRQTRCHPGAHWSCRNPFTFLILSPPGSGDLFPRHPVSYILGPTWVWKVVEDRGGVWGPAHPVDVSPQRPTCPSAPSTQGFGLPLVGPPLARGLSSV